MIQYCNTFLASLPKSMYCRSQSWSISLVGWVNNLKAQTINIHPSCSNVAEMRCVCVSYCIQRWTAAGSCVLQLSLHSPAAQSVPQLTDIRCSSSSSRLYIYAFGCVWQVRSQAMYTYRLTLQDRVCLDYISKILQPWPPWIFLEIMQFPVQNNAILLI